MTKLFAVLFTLLLPLTSSEMQAQQRALSRKSAPTHTLVPTEDIDGDGWDDGDEGWGDGDDEWGDEETDYSDYETDLPISTNISVEEWLFRDAIPEYVEMVEEDWAMNADYWDGCSTDEIYNTLVERIKEMRYMMDPDLWYPRMRGLDPETNRPLIAPIFKGNPDFESSKMALALIQAFKSRFDLDALSDDLEEAYSNGTLDEALGMEFLERCYVYIETEDRYTNALGMLIDKYEAEYAKANWHCYAPNYWGNDPSHNGYIRDFHKSDIKKEPFKQAFVMYDEDFVGGYYMVPSSKGSNTNPKSWTLWGFAAGTATEVPDSDYGLPEFGDTHRIPSTDDLNDENAFHHLSPNDPEYAKQADRYNRWTIISQVKDADLASMPRDEQGRIFFPAQQPYEKCTHLLLVVDGVTGENSKGEQEMYLTNFYYNGGKGIEFKAEKTEIHIDEDPAYIAFKPSTGGSENQQLVRGSINMTLRHVGADMYNYEDIKTTLSPDANGIYKYEISKLYADQGSFDRFPYRVGHWCDAILEYNVLDARTGKTTTEKQTFPIKVNLGQPYLYMGNNAEGDYMINNREEDATYQYPIVIDNLDPARGFSFDVYVNDYTTGRLAVKEFNYTARPGEIDYFNTVESNLSWVKFEPSDWGTSISEKLKHSQTVKAIITVPVTTIPMSDDANVSVRAMNDYWTYYRSPDPHLVLADQYIWMGATVYNNAFTPELIKGTYVTGSRYKQAPRDIHDWEDNDAALLSQIQQTARANIEDVTVIDSLIQVDLGRTVKTIQFDYPKAWGDVSLSLVTDNSVRKIAGQTKDGRDGSEHVYNQSTFSRTVEFPRDGKKHSLVLSWQDGRFSQSYDFTTTNDALKGIFCFVPTVVDDTEDKVYDVTISYGKIVNGGMTNRKSHRRSGHFGARTKHIDNKVYILDDDINEEELNVAYAALWKFNCKLESNNFVGTFNTRVRRNNASEIYSVIHVNIDDHKYGIHKTNEDDTPYGIATQHPINIDLRSDAQFARVSVVDESGNALNNATVRYIFAEQNEADNSLNIGTDSEYSPFLTNRDDAHGQVENTSGENIYLIPLIASEDPMRQLHLFVEASTTDKTKDGKPYSTRIFCETLDGKEFRDCMQSGDVYTCVLGKQKQGEGDFYVHDLWVRDTTYNALDEGISRFNPNITNVMSYTGCDSLSIDLLLRRKTEAPEVQTYVLAPLLEGEDNWQGRYKPYDTFLKPMRQTLDAQGRPIRWTSSQTGFLYDYEMYSCSPNMLQPAKRDDQDVPDIYNLVLWQGKQEKNEEGKLVTKVLYDKTMFGDETNAKACAPAIGAQNYAKDNSRELAKEAEKALDQNLPEMRFGKDMGFPGNIMSAFARLQFNGPDCFPFQMMIGFEEDHYKLRGAFEYNALDVLPGYAAYQASNKFMQRVSKVEEEYNRVKNAIDPDKEIADSELPTLPDAFAGFKGYFDAGLYWDKQDSIWRPFFNDLVARYEASCSVRAILPFLGVGSINFGLNAEAYAQFMVSNPAPTDMYLGNRNYLSHFNIYGMIGANVDVKAAVQVGFDIGIAAACAGIRGAASASIDGAVATRPWLPSGNDGKYNYGLRFAAQASMSAFAKARFLFIEKQWEHKFFNTGRKVLFVPNSNKNPYLSDPNLADPEDMPTKVRLRRAGSQFKIRHAAPKYRAREILSGIDAFSTPTYMGHEGQIAYFNLNNPDSFMDDRIAVRNGSTVTTVNEEDQKPAVAFSTATAPGKDVSILAIQCMDGLNSDFDGSNTSEENQMEAAKKTQIVAVVNNGSSMGEAKVISQDGKTHMVPKTGIDAAGNAAIVWPSGDMEFVTTEDGSTNGIIKGDLNLSLYDGHRWSDPVSLAELGKGCQVSDYAVGMSNGSPVVMATIPDAEKSGSESAPVYAITYVPTSTGGSTAIQSLGFSGSNHQVVSLSDGRFIAATKTSADSIGADIIIYEGAVKNGVLEIKNLGRLGLNQKDITAFRIVTPKTGTDNIEDLSIVWSQHDIKVLDAQENEAVGSNACYASRLTTIGGLSLSHPVLLYELTDDDNVANIDAYSSGENEITSLICVTGAGAEASTGAYVLQSDVKLTNQLKSIGARLDGNITKGEDARIKLTVQNAGVDPVTSLHATVGEITTSADVNILPGEVGTISIALPSGTDFSKDIKYGVDATFTSARNSERKETNGFESAFRLDIADLNAKLLYNRLDSVENVVKVLASINDRTVSEMRDEYTIKVGVYQDPNGQNIYPGTSILNFSPSDFRIKDSNARKAVMAGFKMKTYENTDARAYLIVNTVTPEGDVVSDQDLSDNSLMIALDRTRDGEDNDDDAIKPLTYEDFENGELKISNNGSGIVINDIDTKHDVKIYGPGGQLMHWITPKSNTLSIPKIHKGILLICNGSRAGKILH